MAKATGSDDETKGSPEAALAAAGVGTWSHGIARGESAWDGAMCALFGLPPAPLRLSWAAWIGRIHPEDRAAFEAEFADAVAGGRQLRVECRIAPEPRPPCHGRWLEMVGRGEYDPDSGAPVRIRGIALDVTARKEAELATRRASDELQAVYDTSPVGLCVFDAELRWVRINGVLAAINGLPVEAHRGRRIRDLLPDIGEQLEAICRRVLDTGEAAFCVTVTGATPARPGAARVWETDWLPLRDPATGRITAVNAVAREVTGERALRTALAESEARYRGFVEASSSLVWRTTPEGAASEASPSWRAFTGQGFEEQRGFGFLDAVHPEDRQAMLAARHAAFASGTIYEAKYRLRRHDGAWRRVVSRGTVVRDAAGQPIEWVGTCVDITDREATETALAQSEERFRLAQDAGRIGIFDHDLTTDTIFWDRHARGFWGLGEDEPINTAVFIAGVHPDDLPALQEASARTFDPAGDGQYGTEFRVVNRQDGMARNIAASGRTTFRDGRAVRIVGTLRDVTAERAAQAAQRESEAMFRVLVDAIPQIAFSAAPDGVIDYTNSRWHEYSGMTAEETMHDGWTRAAHPDDIAATHAAGSEALARGTIHHSEVRLRRADGEYRTFLARALPVRGEDGAIVRWFGTATDISDIVAARDTAARQAEELERQVAERTSALREAVRELAAEMQRREETQAAILQSQKLEAIGHLTSGVAHDFGNVLTAISGSYRMIRDTTEDDQIHAHVEVGQRAVDRATRLIRQLLAFTRRDKLRPEAVALRALFASAEDLIWHAIGLDIHCVFEAATGVWPVLADPHQLEIALLNLAVNARDAMVEGKGSVTIEARNLARSERPAPLAPGDYVSITVRDDGGGMPPDVVARAAEPFFTTKTSGAGLGLAQVQSFVATSGGMLRITSDAGQGTTVEIILPRASS